MDKVKFSQYNSKISTTFDIKCASGLNFDNIIFCKIKINRNHRLGVNKLFVDIINNLDNWTHESTERIVMPPSMPHVPNSAEEPDLNYL